MSIPMVNSLMVIDRLSQLLARSIKEGFSEVMLDNFL
jgi:hypothetical protein